MQVVIAVLDRLLVTCDVADDESPVCVIDTYNTASITSPFIIELVFHLLAGIASCTWCAVECTIDI